MFKKYIKKILDEYFQEVNEKMNEVKVIVKKVEKKEKTIEAIKVSLIDLTTAISEFIEKQEEYGVAFPDKKDEVTGW